MTTKTETPELSRAQLHTLIAISRGLVSMPAPGIGYDLGTWRVHGPHGRAVTATVDALIRKGLVRENGDVVDDRRVAVATAAGIEEISRRSRRGR